MTELEKAHARIAALEADLESIGAGGVSGPLVRTPTSGAADLPEALRLANVLDLAKQIDYYNHVQDDLEAAAAELRRLHAYCQELEAQVIRDCMTHVQNPAENEHVADDMSKNGAGSNTPQPAPPADSVLEDAARYQWLAPRLLAADFDYQNQGECVLVFEWPKDVAVGGDCSQNIDAARKQGGA